MTPIRINAPVVHYGDVQLVEGQVLEVPDFLADALAADDSAEVLSAEEYTQLCNECTDTSLPVPTAAARPKKRGRR